MDIEKLICIVQGFPVLYNTSHPDYTRTKMKDDVWREVGAEFELEGSDMKSQWLKLRECHREAIRRQKKKSGQRGVPTKPWIYQKQMEFLLPFMKNRCSSSNVQLETQGSAEEGEERTDKDEPNEQYVDDIVNEQLEIPIKIDTFPDEEEHPQYIEAKKLRKGNCYLETDVTSVNVTTPRKNLVKLNPLQRFIGLHEMRAKKRGVARKKVLSEIKVSKKEDALYQFFMAMYSTAKELPASYQRSIRNEIFQIVTKTEEQYELDKSLSEGRHDNQFIPSTSLPGSNGPN